MVNAEGLLRRKPSEEIWSIAPDQPVLEAIRMMAERGIGALLVMEAGKLVGMVSERDYARKVVLLGRASNDTPVRQIMSAPVVTVRGAESLDACMRLMTEKRIRHLPVVDTGRVLGMLSIGDLVKAVIDDQKKTIDELTAYIHS
jgi:CBS domain-containing protein